MKASIHSFIIILFILTSVDVFSQSAKRSFQLKDLRKLVRLSSPQISPDGRQIAVIVSRPNWKKDKNNQEIDLINISDRLLRKITYNRKSISETRWSPDGGLLAFIAKDTDKKNHKYS